MKGPILTTDSRALFLERLKRFLAIDDKPASKRTASEKYDQTWLVEDTLRRIEVATEADDMAALAGLRGEFIAAYNAGDASTLATLFTEDGVVMPPNSSAANGKEAVQSFYQVHFEQFTGTLAVSSEEHEAASDWAFERGSYTVTLAPKAGGTPTDDEGKYLLISKRQPDASWRIARHIWNRRRSRKHKAATLSNGRLTKPARREGNGTRGTPRTRSNAGLYSGDGRTCYQLLRQCWACARRLQKHLRSTHRGLAKRAESGREGAV